MYPLAFHNLDRVHLFSCSRSDSLVTWKNNWDREELWVNQQVYIVRQLSQWFWAYSENAREFDWEGYSWLHLERKPRWIPDLRKWHKPPRSSEVPSPTAGIPIALSFSAVAWMDFPIKNRMILWRTLFPTDAFLHNSWFRRVWSYPRKSRAHQSGKGIPWLPTEDRSRQCNFHWGSRCVHQVCLHPRIPSFDCWTGTDQPSQDGCACAISRRCAESLVSFVLCMR